MTYPGDPGDGLRPACAILPATKDHDWIPLVAGKKWITVTRDRHILHRPAEVAAIKDNDARVICLDARHELTKWLELEIMVTQWRQIETLAGVDGPWVYRASRTRLTKEM
ncbi:MAG: PIN-like domain-containing protein [Acidimicrobiales bacterium]